VERNVVDELSRALPRRRRAAIARELRAHVEDAQRDLQLAGWHPAAAAKEAAARLGDAQEIAGAFAEVYRPSRRTRVGLALAVATGMILGIYGLGGNLASAHAGKAQTHMVRAHAVAPAPATRRPHS
jgi:hypothetical protein